MVHKKIFQNINHYRKNGISAEIYPDNAKIGKQMNYANAKQIPYVVIAGEDEIKEHLFTLKNMTTGEQAKCTLPEIIEIVSKN